LDRNAGPLRQPLQGLGIGQLLMQHHKIEYIPACAACKAFKDLLGLADIHTGAMIIMEWTDPHHLPPLFYQAYVFTNYISDSIRFSNPIDCGLIH
jgi:hypothetical protein